VAATLIYWDSDAFLAWLESEPGKAELSQGTLERAKAGEVLIITSALTLTEVLWRKGGPKLPAAKAETLRKFFRHSYIRIVNLSRAIAEQAQDVVWNHSIKPKDAVHVATALFMKAPILETFDEDLLKKSGQVGLPPLVIQKPKPPKQPGLNFNA